MAPMEHLKLILQEAAATLELDLSNNQLDTLISYLTMLAKWNDAYNLSGIKKPDLMLTHHIIDSLAIVSFLSKAQHVLDVGTGAGLPGVVLAVCYPEKSFTLLDSNGKKIRFLKQVKYDLKINNITPVQVRMEKYQTTECFDGIISRALGAVEELVRNTKHLLCKNGHWYAMKGTYPEAELDGLSHPYVVKELAVPKLDSARHLVIVEE